MRTTAVSHTPHLATRLRGLRRQRELSQTELGTLAGGLPQQYISALERGLRPAQDDHLDRLAQALRVDVDQLLGRRRRLPDRPAQPAGAAYLRMARAASGWSRREVAQRTGLPLGRVVRLEAGAPPHPDELQRLAIVLDRPELLPVAATLRQAVAVEASPGSRP